MSRRVAMCPASLRVEAALAAAERAQADVLVLRPRSAVRRHELLRASRWGLGGLRVEAMAWHELPAVAAGAPELDVRRLLLAGAPMILVEEGRYVIGVIDRERSDVTRPALSLVHRLDRLESRGGEAWLWLCRVAGKVGEGLGVPVYAVAGFVRDILLDRRPMDLDVLVEGDGVAFARRLVEEVGGNLVPHPEFGTASIEGAGRGEAAGIARVDIASARRERYDAPGALPVVSAASVDEDLRRRDFSVNAMAMALSPSSFGRLLDPLGGQLDLKRRRLRPLEPLSFVEDPTRIFRAARYAARLGFRLDDRGARALRLALSVGQFPALSGHRLRAEIELMAAEPSGWRGLELLVRWQALKLWDRGYRRAARAPARLKAIHRLCAWGLGQGIALHPGQVALVALLVDQPPAVVDRCLSRLAVSGAPLKRFREAAAAGSLARRLDGPRWRRPSEVAAVLDARAVPVLVGAWLLGGRRARHRIQWFLSQGRTIRPLLSGDDVVALGGRRGPEVAECLAELRRRRLDGALSTLTEERAFVREFLGARASQGGEGHARENRRLV